MNKEYIERDAVVVFLENMAASRYLIQCFESKEQFPAADVAPVRHGEWILYKDGSGTCNQCGITANNIWDYDGWQNYCGHCGARMDGGNK